MNDTNDQAEYWEECMREFFRRFPNQAMTVVGEPKHVSVGLNIHEMNVLRTDLRHAHKHLSDAVDWTKANPERPAAAVSYLLANAERALDAINEAGSWIAEVQSLMAIESVRGLFEKKEGKE